MPFISSIDVARGVKSSLRVEIGKGSKKGFEEMGNERGFPEGTDSFSTRAKDDASPKRADYVRTLRRANHGWRSTSVVVRICANDEGRTLYVVTC